MIVGHDISKHYIRVVFEPVETSRTQKYCSLYIVLSVIVLDIVRRTRIKYY